MYLPSWSLIVYFLIIMNHNLLNTFIFIQLFCGHWVFYMYYILVIVTYTFWFDIDFWACKLLLHCISSAHFTYIKVWQSDFNSIMIISQRVWYSRWENEGFSINLHRRILYNYMINIIWLRILCKKKGQMYNFLFL